MISSRLKLSSLTTSPLVYSLSSLLRYHFSKISTTFFSLLCFTTRRIVKNAMTHIAMTYKEQIVGILLIPRIARAQGRNRYAAPAMNSTKTTSRKGRILLLTLPSTERNLTYGQTMRS